MRVREILYGEHRYMDVYDIFEWIDVGFKYILHQLERASLYGLTLPGYEHIWYYINLPDDYDNPRYKQYPPTPNRMCRMWIGVPRDKELRDDCIDTQLIFTDDWPAIYYPYSTIEDAKFLPKDQAIYKPYIDEILWLMTKIDEGIQNINITMKIFISKVRKKAREKGFNPVGMMYLMPKFYFMLEVAGLVKWATDMEELPF